MSDGFTQAEINSLFSSFFAGDTNKIDALTGCKNATALQEDLDMLLNEADQKYYDVSIAITDIDEFMKVNADFGHKIGDDVLKEAANTLNELNCAKTVFRYSGDSFAVLFPKSEKEKVFLIMEEFRKAIKEKDEFKKTSSTISVGIATYPEDGANQTELLRKADGALYRAKTSGRDKICLAKEEKLVTKTAHYTIEQLQRLKDLSESTKIGEAALMREALDELLKKYDAQKKAKKPKVLIIDDSGFMRMMLKDILIKGGYDVVGEAADGLEGLKEFEKHNPDFTILDITMPNMDGIAFLRKLKEERLKKENNKVIMLTAVTGGDFVLAAIENDADAFIAKPFQAERLTDVLGNIEKYKISTEHYESLKDVLHPTYRGDRALSQQEIDELIEKIRISER